MILPESYKNKTKIDIELKVQTNKNYFYIKIMCSISVRQNGGILNLNVTLNGQNLMALLFIIGLIINLINHKKD